MTANCPVFSDALKTCATAMASLHTVVLVARPQTSTSANNTPNVVASFGAVE